MEIRSGTCVCLLSFTVSVVLYRLGSNPVRNGGKCAEFSSDLFKDVCNNANNDSRYTADNTQLALRAINISVALLSTPLRYLILTCRLTREINV